ncbi:hypothetical protein [Exiguobacterium artemiae]
MDYELDRIIYYLNRDFRNHLGSFSGTILKDTSPAIILIEDHVRRHLAYALYQYPEFVSEIEETIFRCLIDVRGKKNRKIQRKSLLLKPSYILPIITSSHFYKEWTAV